MTSDQSAQSRPTIKLGKDEQLLSVKELAWHLNRHPNYVYLMRKAGFPMPGSRTSSTSGTYSCSKASARCVIR